MSLTSGNRYLAALVKLAAASSNAADTADTIPDIKPKWHPPEGFFTQSSDAIASGLKRAGEGKAMSRLNFYINRAGKNLSPEDRARLEAAKAKLAKS